MVLAHVIKGQNWRRPPQTETDKLLYWSREEAQDHRRRSVRLSKARGHTAVENDRRSGELGSKPRTDVTKLVSMGRLVSKGITWIEQEPVSGSAVVL